MFKTLDKRELFIISAKIVLIELVVESYIMIFLLPIIENNFHFSPIIESLFDPLLLIMMTTPLIVVWVLGPYVRKRDEVEQNLKNLQMLAEQAKEEKQELLTRQDYQMQSLMNLTTDLRKSELRYNTAMNAIREGVWELNLKDNTLYLSPRWKEIMGFAEKGFPNNFLAWALRIHADDKAEFLHKIAESQKNTDARGYVCEFRIKHKDGYYIWVNTRWVTHIEGDETKLIGSCAEITTRKKLEERLVYEANHDSLTTLPNRRQLVTKLDDSLERFKNDENNKFALLFIDVDQFKLINDTLGHHAGDVLLATIAQRLRVAIRLDDLVARLGGDEFAIILDDFGDEADLELVLKRIVESIRKPLRLRDKTITPNVSIGAVIANEQYIPLSAQEVMMDADLALYKSKEERRGSYTFYNDGMKNHASEVFDIVNNMRNALDHGEIEMYYQPIIDFVHDKIVGFESLVRWNHPERGLLMPGDFLQFIEGTELVHDLARFSFARAMSDFKSIQKTVDCEELFITVNVSMRQLEREDLIDDIEMLMHEHGISGAQLKVEVSESVITKDSEFIDTMLSKLHEMKIKIALDDFGIGNSSLWSLARYPFDTIKIDQSFIADIENNDRCQNLVKMINKVSKSIDVNVVAEGVETTSQLNTLKKIGIEKLQGYCFCKPEPLSKIMQFIAAKPNPSMWISEKKYRRNRRSELDKQATGT